MTNPNGAMTGLDLGVVVLAGGRGTRLGGASKAHLAAGGRTFLDILLGQLPYGAPVAVVSPFPLGRPQVAERPLFGGPVAGIAAARLETDLIAILSVDAPDSPQLLPALTAALAASPADCALVRSADGHLQPLCAVWRRPALERALEGIEKHNASMRQLLRGVRVLEVPGTGAEADVDTPAALRDFRAFRLKPGLSNR